VEHADMGSDDGTDIGKVIRSLRKASSLRQLAEVVLADPRAAIEDLRPILRPLTNRSVFRGRERAVAAWLIGSANWSDAQRNAISEALCVSVERAMKAKKPSRIVLRWFARAWCLTFIFCCALYWSDPLAVAVRLSDVILASTILTVVGYIVTLPLSVWVDNRSLRRSRRVIECLGQLGEAGSTATIATAYMHDPLRPAAASALARVAARLRPEDLGAVPGPSVPALCSALAKADARTTLAILQALTVIGDGRAVHAVEHLANWRADAVVGGGSAVTALEHMVNGLLTPDVRDAATRLLPILQQRAEESQAASQLLRPSMASGDGEKVLLRAAAAGAAADAPDVLVRASEQPGEPS
jgi:hypothetical protein